MRARLSVCGGCTYALANVWVCVVGAHTCANPRTGEGKLKATTSLNFGWYASFFKLAFNFKHFFSYASLVPEDNCISALKTPIGNLANDL